MTELMARSTAKTPTIQNETSAGNRVTETSKAIMPATSANRQLSSDRLMKGGRDAVTAKELIGAYLPGNGEEKTQKTGSRVFR